MKAYKTSRAVKLGALLLLAAFLFKSGSAQAFAGGDGSSGSPYQITTCSQLSDINGNSSAYYVLANDISCASTPFDHTPITGFGGSFDGANHVISGLIINAPGNNSVGLFGLLSFSAQVSNLTIFATVNGQDNVAILAANTLNDPQISRVATYGVITCDSNCGGLVANLTNGAAISNSYSTASITVASGNAGGLVGTMSGSNVNDSYFNGTILANGDSPLVGGVAGNMNGGQITNAYAAGSITASSSTASIGGIMGGGTFDPGIFSTFAAIQINGGGGPSYNGPICSQSYTIAHGGGNYYDSNLTGFTSSPSDADCSATHITDSNYFKGSGTNHPMDDWLFDSTHWRVVDSDYPVLEPLFDPVMFCEEPQSTDSTITGSCSYIPQGWGTPTWEARWSVHDANDWHTITLADIHTAAATVTGLTPGTEYDLEFRFTNNFGVGQWAKEVILTTGTAPISNAGSSSGGVVHHATAVSTENAVVASAEAASTTDQVTPVTTTPNPVPILPQPLEQSGHSNLVLYAKWGFGLASLLLLLLMLVPVLIRKA